MRIVCDNCGAKYQISDEKVRNKVFKIRCKRCTHVIVVRAGQDQAGEPAQQSMEEPGRLADAAMTDESSDAIWYVVVNREQLGPMTRAEVEARFERGEVDAETFGWAEGMAEWLRLASIPDFAHLTPAPAAPVAAVAAAPVAAPRFSPAVEPDEDVIASNNRSVGAPAPSAGLFGRDDDGFDEGPRGGGGSARHLRGQRNENSVLFSLDSLAADVDARPAAAAAGSVTNTGGTEGSGLIDISALGGRGGGLDSAFGGGGGSFAPVPTAPAGPMPSLMTQRSGNGLKVALLVVGILLLVGGGIAVTAILLNKDDPKQPVAAAPSAPVSAAVVSVAPPTAAPATVAAPVTAAAPASIAAASEAPGSEAPASLAVAAPASEARGGGDGDRRPAGGRTPRVGRTPRAGDTEDGPPERVERVAPATAAPAAAPTAAARKPAGGSDEVDDLLGGLDRKPAAGRPAGGGDPPPVAAGGGDDPMLPERLTRQQILLVVKQGASAINGCKSQDSDSGTVTVAMVIEPKGNVSSASVASGPLKGSPAGNCVEQKVKGFKFPQFRGEPMRINMPFAL